MPAPVTLSTRQALQAQETGEAFLMLLTIEHPSLPMPIRVSSDKVDTSSRGEAFLAFAFDITLPSDTEDGPPRAQLTIDNVNRQIVAAVRSLAPDPPPTLLVEMVRGAAPDTVERAYPRLDMQSVSYDALRVTAQLGIDSLLREPFPAGRFDRVGFPGLFT